MAVLSAGISVALAGLALTVTAETVIPAWELLVSRGSASADSTGRVGLLFVGVSGQ